MANHQAKGRPPVAAPFERIRSVRFSAEEDQQIEDAAREAGLKPSRWIREAAVAAAKARKA